MYYMKNGKQYKRLYGAGINDADYNVEYCVNGEKYICPYFEVWKGMIRRCYSKETHMKRPTYSGCTVCGEWLIFSSFKQWMMNKDWKGKHLDKDLLKLGNKIYSPSNCCFINIELNSFMATHGKHGKYYPLGVSRCEKTKNYTLLKQFIARCGKQYLGYFSTPEEAHKAWQKEKYEQALLFCVKEYDPIVKSGLLRVCNKLKYEYDNNIETTEL